jgi:hypothetical protein
MPGWVSVLKRACRQHDGFAPGKQQSHHTQEKDDDEQQPQPTDSVEPPLADGVDGRVSGRLPLAHRQLTVGTIHTPGAALGRPCQETTTRAKSSTRMAALAVTGTGTPGTKGDKNRRLPNIEPQNREVGAVGFPS